MAGVEGLSHLRREDVIDARHRVILEQLAIAQGNFDVAMQALPDELADCARDLQISVDDGDRRASTPVRQGDSER